MEMSKIDKVVALIGEIAETYAEVERLESLDCVGDKIDYQMLRGKMVRALEKALGHPTVVQNLYEHVQSETDQLLDALEALDQDN